jgi:hypothetical protein
MSLQVPSTALPNGQTAGADLTNSNVTITVAQGRWRKLPASTLSGNHTCTLSTVGAIAGDEIEITRYDLTANTYAIIDGGSGTPTLITLAASKLGYVRARFDGANWILKSFGVQ